MDWTDVLDVCHEKVSDMGCLKVDSCKGSVYFLYPKLVARTIFRKIFA